MNDRDWRDLDRRLDDAIDALNDERAPDLAGDDDEQVLLDTLRVVRRLRTRAEPDEEFESRLVGQSLAVVETASLVSSPNGTADQTLPPRQPIDLAQRRRVRFALAQIAAVLRVIGVFVLAGMLSGAVIGGLGGRVVMRVSGYLYQRENPGRVVLTESSGEPVGQISLAGTIELMMQGMFAGILVGLLLLLVAPWLPKTGWRRVGLFGLLLLAAVGPSVINAEDRDIQRFGPPLLNVVMFAGLIVAMGMATPPIARWLDLTSRREGRGALRLGRAALSGVTLVLGGFGLLAIVPAMTVAIGIGGIVVELANPRPASLVIVPLALVVIVLLPLARVAAATPHRPARLDPLRSEVSRRIVTAAIWLAATIGLIIVVVGAARIVLE